MLVKDTSFSIYYKSNFYVADIYKTFLMCTLVKAVKATFKSLGTIFDTTSFPTYFLES